MLHGASPVILRSASDEGSSSYSRRRRKKILRSAQDDNGEALRMTAKASESIQDDRERAQTDRLALKMTKSGAVAAVATAPFF